MGIRFEDRGLTLRLFQSEAEARKALGTHDVVLYGPGWLAKNGAGRWMDENGFLPAKWVPRPTELKPLPTASSGVR